MKYRIKILALLLLVSMLFACNETAIQPEIEEEKSEHQLTVFTSFYPMYDFAKKIGGEKAKIVNMVPVGAEPHDWEPGPKDMAHLEEADIFIYSGAGMEIWVDKVLDALNTDDLKVLEASQDIDLIAFEEDHHEHQEGEEADHQQEETEEHHHHHGEFDPHVWLSVANAKKQMENIKDIFVQVDPENREYYEANYEKYAMEFNRLNERYLEELRGLKNKNIVVAHEAFGYLCQAYGLEQLGIEGINAESEPDAARMAEIIDFVKKNKVTTIYFEELISPKVAETIARETGAKTAMLNPLEGLSQEDLDSGADYLQIMEKNLETLIEGQKD